MSKKIVFCADGTWNHPHSPVVVEDCDTNVYKIYKSLAYTSDQVTFYDDGVGAGGNVLTHLVGGAVGDGLDGLFKKVKEGYTAIAHVYEQGDPIYIFGFSRGAYTARSLAGMIANCGLPTKGFDDQLVETAFSAYRNKSERQALLATLGRYGLFNAPITCLGVWDTVGSLGIPIDPLGLDALRFGFLDTTLHTDVRNAFHAVSIDERRREFPPTLWTGPFAQDQRVAQVWFAGVHCNVGGGYPDSGLSDITLGWMLKNALSCDPQNPIQIVDSAKRYLTIDPKHSLDKLAESWNVLWGFPKRRSLPSDASISDSVAIRVAEDASYRPENLSLNATKLGTSYKVVPVVAAQTNAATGAS